MDGFIGRIIARVGIDKVAHFALSAFIAVALGRFIHWAIALVVTFLLGVVKELLDNKFDWKDILADAVGILIATIINIL